MYLPRELEESIAKWMKKKEIIVIKGPRQAGKTTLLKHLHHIYGGTYINLDIPTYREMLEKNPLSYEGMKEPLYFDEISNVSNAGKSLKLLYDEKEVKMVVTGSGAFEVKENILGNLVGRATVFELLPLSFGEFLLWRYPHVYEVYKDVKNNFYSFLEKGRIPPSPPYLPEMEEAFKEYIYWGGYPRVVLEKEDKKRAMANIVDSALERDIFTFFDIREKRSFSLFLQTLAALNGTMLRLSSLPLPYRTAERYLSILSAEFFVKLLYPFHRNLSTELRKTPKLYFMDLGIVNFLTDGRISTGKLVENFVFIQLERVYPKINYWRTESKAEIDFIVLKDKPLPIEVKAGNIEKVPKAMRSFISAYNPGRAVILTSNTYKIVDIDDTTVLFYPYLWL